MTEQAAPYGDPRIVIRSIEPSACGCELQMFTHYHLIDQRDGATVGVYKWREAAERALQRQTGGALA